MRMKRAWKRWNGLRRRQSIGSNAGHFNFALFDGIDRFSGFAIQIEQMPELGRLHERRDTGAISWMLEQYRLRGNIVVPHIVADSLKVPPHLTRCRVEGDHRARVVVEPFTLTAVIVGRRVACRNKNKAALFINREHRPRIGRSSAITNHLSRFVRGLDERFAWRQRIPTPPQVTRVRIVGPHHTAGRVGANVVEYECAGDQHAIDDGRRRRHAVFTRVAVADASSKINHPVFAKATTRRAVICVEGNHPRVERAHKDFLTTAFADRHVGIHPVRHTAARDDVHPRGINLGVEHPSLFPRIGVEGNHLIARRANVERVVYEDRCVLEGGSKFGFAAIIDIARVVHPSDFKGVHVVAIDLGERRISRTRTVGAVG